ncbi:hypothetical protein [Patulibacter sp. SYSU D01012]|uniref:hypothetical protein n=1 Tax=Patulibacter sp. SYSU D01012 TaxID=2817381 RepID=UPI001B315714|nr:hypothetical protein [Patulibacter sp. SYSU D01012]
MIQLPQLQESLLLANDRLIERAQRRARRFRLGLFTSVAVVGASGVAVGAGALWGPILGHEDGNRPTSSATPAPSAQVQLLSVLRRPQTAADRGPDARAVLRAATARYGGLRTDTVRRVGTLPDGRSIVLLSVERLAPRVDAAPQAQRDALCLYLVRRTTVSQSNCVSVGAVEQGRASLITADAAAAVVPDGVSAVRIQLRSGGTRDVPVKDNAFVADTSDLAPASPVARWLGADGRVLPKGTDVAGAPIPAAAPGWHVCADKYTVPEDVPCGPQARRWRPAPGQAGPLPPAQN